MVFFTKKILSLLPDSRQSPPQTNNVSLTEEEIRKRDLFKQKVEKTIDINGLNISYVEAGNPDNPTLLLIHGIASNKKVWYNNIDGGEMPNQNRKHKQFRRKIIPLAEHFHIIAPDLPGFGESHKPKQVTHEYLVKSFMPEFTNRLNIGKMHLAGISMGGAVSIGYALDHPETIDSLHLMCPFGLKPYRLGTVASLALRNPTISKTGISLATNGNIGRHIKKIFSYLGHLDQEVENNIEYLISYMASIDNSSLEWLSDQVKTPLLEAFRGTPMRTNYSDSILTLSKNIKHIFFYHDPKDPIIPFRNTHSAYNTIKTEGNSTTRLTAFYGVGHQLYLNPGYLNEIILRELIGLSRPIEKIEKRQANPEENAFAIINLLIEQMNRIFRKAKS